MNPTDTADRTLQANRLASLAALVAVAAGVMVLAGWALDITLLKSILPGWVSMKANTAACFILIGSALWLNTGLPATVDPSIATRLARLSQALGGLAGLVGLLTLGEYAFGWALGLDQFLFVEPVGTVGTSTPGRMAPETATCFVLLAVGVWFAGTPHKTRLSILLSAGIGLLVAALALAAILSYATPVLGAYGWFGLTIMAMHTATLFTLLGVAILATSWRPDVLAWSLSRSVTVAFLVCIVLLTIIGLTTSRAQFQLKEIQRQIAYSEKVMASTSDLMFEVLGTQSHTRGYVITGQDRFLANYLDGKAHSYAKLEGLRTLVAGHPHQQRLSEQIEVRVTNLLRWFQQVIDARQSGMAAEQRNRMVLHGEELLEQLTATADQIAMSSRQHVAQLQLEEDSVSRASYIVLFSGTLASVLIFLVTIFRLNVVENERKTLAETLHDNAIKLRSLSRHALEAQETERRRLAIELHDELGQALAAIKINLQAHGRFKGQPPAELIAENIDIVEEALLQVRRLALALRPSMLDDLGLIPALQSIAEQSEERDDLVVQFDADLPQSRFAPEVEIACFRIVQECLNNIVRHAQARFVKIDLHHEGDTLVLSVEDDGCGFDPVAMRDRALAGDSMGMLGMQERASLIGGQLDIQSTAGQGSRVCLRCPLHISREAM